MGVWSLPIHLDGSLIFLPEIAAEGVAKMAAERWELPIKDFG